MPSASARTPPPSGARSAARAPADTRARPATRRAPALAAVVLAGSAHAAGPAFVPADIADWPRRILDGHTDYRLVEDAGRPAVRAVADNTATALYREVEVDLAETPYLEWSWRVDALPAGDAGERARAGDDYGARLYLVREGLFGKLSARALNYVWSRREPVGATWPNAFSERARMIAVASGGERLGEWVTYRRDVRADWQKAFGETVGRIDAVAVMTDSDNTDSTARALYGAIRFVAADDE